MSNGVVSSLIFSLTWQRSEIMAPTQPKFIECQELFHHHQPIPEEVMRLNTIGGRNGAFRAYLASREADTGELTVGVGVRFSPTGEILGSELLTCGSIEKIPKMSTKDMWPDAPHVGSLTFGDFDAGIFTMPNGLLTSNWIKTEENLINKRVKLTVRGKTSRLKQASMSDHGFGDITYRATFQPMTPSCLKLSLGGVPRSGTELASMRNHSSRSLPVIKIYDARARLYPVEVAHQKFGLGFQPILILTGGQSYEDGSLDLDNVTYPPSMDVKKAAVMLLQNSTMPNSKSTARTWQESIDKEDYTLRESTLKWPGVRDEDEEDTEDSSVEEETDGKSEFD